MLRGLVVSLVLFATPALADPPARPFSRRQEISFEYLAGVGAAALTVPSMIAAGGAIGRSTNDLGAALAPSLLLQIAVPPVAVTLAMWAVGRFGLRDGSRFHPAIWAAIGVNLVAVIVGAAIGVAAGDEISVLAYTMTDALLMPAATAAVMHRTRRRDAAPPELAPPPSGALPAPRAVNLFAVSF
jgi:uncharacterized membrane protein YfcA